MNGRNWQNGFLGTILFLVLICGIGVFVRIVFWSPTIGSPVSESEVVVRANERLLEMVKWTISTILLIGGGLIGVNWYQNSRSLDERFAIHKEALDRQLEGVAAKLGTIDDLTSELRRSTTSIEQTARGAQDQLMATIVAQEMANAEGNVTLALVRLLESEHILDPTKSYLIQTVIGLLRNTVHPLQIINQFGPYLPNLAQAADRLALVEERKAIELAMASVLEYQQRMQREDQSDDPNIPE